MNEIYELPEGFKWEPLIEGLKVVDVKDGDIFVLETGAKLSAASQNSIIDCMREILNQSGFKKSPVIVFDGGLHLSAILRRDE